MMKWEAGKTKIQDHCWFSGIYKIVKYVDSEMGYRIGNRNGDVYHAFYKPDGWANWGNHVDRGTPHYKTLKAAQGACVSHATA